MKHYKEFLITAEPFNADILSSILWELNISGINEDVNCLRVFVDDGISISKEDIEDTLLRLKNNNMLFNFYVEENLREYKNWNKEWEDNLNIIKIENSRFVIKPTTKVYNAEPNEIVITIDPKMSFGTGEHQTTKLMLEMLEKYSFKDMKVLDVGTGTGVLVIAAIKLGAKSALGFDIDEWCFENSKENFAINEVGNNAKILLGDIFSVPKDSYDLVLANIQKNILTEIAENLKLFTNKNGKIILSGLLFTDKEDIIKTFTSIGLTYVESNQLDDWITIILNNDQLK